ncbi:MAG: histidine kinase [Sphingobacterium sp.]|nr:histidine kinase [Sphingobacterium sp.]
MKKFVFTKNQVVFQVVFWGFIFTFYSLHYHRLVSDFKIFLLFSAKDLLIAMLSFYFWPEKLFRKNMISLRLCAIIVFWVAAIFVTWAFVTYFLCYTLRIHDESYSYRFEQYLNAFVGMGFWRVLMEWRSFAYEILVLFLLSVSPRFFRMIVSENINKAKLEREETEWELNVLKSEINPPLLFNTLNHIYYLLDVDINKGKDLIIHLSNLMSYTLYDSKNEYIEVSREIEAVEDYLLLMRNFFDKRIHINWEMVRMEEPYIIRPLLIIPIINDVLKKGDRDSWCAEVNISIDIVNDHLMMDIYRRNLDECAKGRETEYYMDEEMNLYHARKRLNLYYKDRSEIVDTGMPGSRYLGLKLNLKSF